MKEQNHVFVMSRTNAESDKRGGRGNMNCGPAKGNALTANTRLATKNSSLSLQDWARNSKKCSEEVLGCTQSLPGDERRFSVRLPVAAGDY